MNDNRRCVILNPPDIIGKYFYYSTGVPLALANLQAKIKGSKITDYEFEFVDCKSKNALSALRMLHRLNIDYKIVRGFLNKRYLKRYYQSSDIKDIKYTEFLKNATAKSLPNTTAYSAMLYKSIINKNTPVIGFSIMSHRQMENAIITAKYLKKIYDPFIIAGGPLISAKAELLRKIKIDGIFDMLVEGDGTQALIAAASTKESKRSTQSGIGYTKSPEVTQNSGFDLIPDYSGLDVKEVYLRLSQGCIWGKCSFCQRGDNITYSAISPVKAAEMFKEIKKRYNPRSIHLMDNSLPGRYLINLAKELIKKDIKVVWKIFHTILDPVFLEPDGVKLMEKSGCRSIRFGVETMSPRVLGLMNKNHDTKMVKPILKRFSETKINTVLLIMLGFPTETKEDALTTLKFLKDNKDLYDKIGVQRFCLERGTYICNNPDEYGITSLSSDEYIKRYNERARIKFKTKTSMDEKEVDDIIMRLHEELPEKINSPLTYFLDNY